MCHVGFVWSCERVVSGVVVYHKIVGVTNVPWGSSRGLTENLPGRGEKCFFSEIDVKEESNGRL